MFGHGLMATFGRQTADVQPGVVRPAGGGEATAGRTVATETVAGKDLDAVAAAHSRALATVSGDIAAAIRAQASVPRAPTPRRTAR